MAPPPQQTTKPKKPNKRGKIQTQAKTENSSNQEDSNSMGQRKSKRIAAISESPKSSKELLGCMDDQNKRRTILTEKCEQNLSTNVLENASNSKIEKNEKVLESSNFNCKMNELNESTPNKIIEKKDASNVLDKNMNKTENAVDYKHDLLNNTEMLNNCSSIQEDSSQKKPVPGCTVDDIKEFLSNSSIKHIIPLDLDMENPIKLFEKLNSTIYELQDVLLEELLDLYHLAIMMQTHQKLQTNLIAYRIELLNAVGELSAELQPDFIELIGIGLCDRFVIGTGKERMDRVINLLSALTPLINQNDANRNIAMTVLLATFAKISGVSLAVQHTDIIMTAFEMAKLVNWTQIIAAGSAHDLFLLMRCFSMIINTRHNRDAHTNWYTQLGSEIHLFFMNVLNTVRFPTNYDCFAMMVERFIAFCVVRGSTPRVYSSDVFDTKSS